MFSLRSKKAISTFSGHSGAVSTVTIDGEYETVISGDSKGELRFWNISENKCQKVIEKAHMGWINTSKCRKYGTMPVVVTGSSDGFARTWDYEGNVLNNCRKQDSSIKSICILDQIRDTPPKKKTGKFKVSTMFQSISTDEGDLMSEVRALQKEQNEDSKTETIEI